MFIKKFVVSLSSIVLLVSICPVECNAKQEDKEVLWSKYWQGYAIIPYNLTTFNDNKSSDKYNRYRIFDETSYRNTIPVDYTLYVYSDYTYTYSISIDKDVIIDVSDTVVSDKNVKIPIIQFIGLDNQTTKNAFENSTYKLEFSDDTYKMTTKNTYTFSSSNAISIYVNGYDIFTKTIDSIVLKKGVLFLQENVSYTETKKSSNYYYHVLTDKYNNKSYYKYYYNKNGKIYKTVFEDNSSKVIDSPIYFSV